MTIPAYIEGLDRDSCIYIAGPMSIRKDIDWNFPAFLKLEEDLRKMGFSNFENPARFGVQDGYEWQDYLRRDIEAILDHCDAVVFLDGWEGSKGACVEYILTRAIGLPQYDQDGIHLSISGDRLRGAIAQSLGLAVPLLPKVVPETILEEAQRLVHGPRQGAYGHPLDDFTRTGQLWGATLGMPAIPPETVGLMMCCLKVSREVNKPGRDNLVDLAGYAETVNLVHTERERRKSGG